MIDQTVSCRPEAPMYIYLLAVVPLQGKMIDQTASVCFDCLTMLPLEVENIILLFWKMIGNVSSAETAQSSPNMAAD